MKIGVVGCGALGSYYGAKLCRDGHAVHFLLRSDYDVVRRRGVFIRSPEGDFHVNPRCARRPEEIGPCDVVLIGLKTTANEQFQKLLPPLVSDQTAVVTLQNGLGNEEQLATLFPREQILGGLCFVCLNRIEPGVIHHLAHGKIVLGEFAGWPEPRAHDIASAIRHSGVPCTVTDNLERAHWEKLVWNIPFNGLGVASAAGYDAVFSGKIKPSASVPLSPQRGGGRGEGWERIGAVDNARTVDATTPHPNPLPVEGRGNQRLPLGPCLTTDQLLDKGRWENLVRELMNEVIAAANAQNLKVDPKWTDIQIERTRSMGAYRASTLIDFERKQPLELEALFLEPLRRAQRTGVATPRLEALCLVLEALDKSGTL